VGLEIGFATSIGELFLLILALLTAIQSNCNYWWRRHLFIIYVDVIATIGRSPPTCWVTSSTRISYGERSGVRKGHEDTQGSRWRQKVLRGSEKAQERQGNRYGSLWGNWHPYTGEKALFPSCRRVFSTGKLKWSNFSYEWCQKLFWTITNA